MVYPGSGRGAVRPAKGVCEGTVLSCTRCACSRGYKQGERGRKAPKSLLEEGLSVASGDVGAISECALRGRCENLKSRPPWGSPPPPFIDTRRDGYMYRGSQRLSFTIVEYCGKYTVGYDVGRGSHHGRRP